jgi:hypothetical protein
MMQLHDTESRPDSTIFTVMVWNADRTKRKIWKNIADDRAKAELEVAALKVHGFDAEIIRSGKV